MVSDRENLRFERTRGFGMVRTMFTALGNRWAEEGQLEDGRDIFFMDLEDVKNTTKVTPEIQQIISG